MFFLLGERVSSESEAIGERACAVCQKLQNFSHVIETNYFCLFGLRILPIEKIANYWRCEHCNNAYVAESLDQPALVNIVKNLLVYVQLGYGQYEHRELTQDICLKVTGFEFTDEEITQEIQAVEGGQVDVLDNLKGAVTSLNLQGKQQIIEAAFLVTHACCEIQYEDRLRINLMGNALGVSIEFVSSVIDHVHAHGCYGVTRLLPTQTKQT